MSEHPPSISADRRFCQAILPEVSRTFALSIDRLPERLREPVRVAYLLCRIVDTVEDSTCRPLSEREQLFVAFDTLMSDDTAALAVFLSLTPRLRGAAADLRLCQRADAVFNCFRALPEAQRRAIRPSVLTMSEGMLAYARRFEVSPLASISDVDDLERYCYFVAGTVGEFLTALFLDFCEIPAESLRAEIRQRAVAFGLGLQLVNIVKDVADDLERGVCFLPQALLRSHELTTESLLDPQTRERGLALMAELCGVARQHLQGAAEYTLLWPAATGAAIRLFCAVPLGLAMATLSVVEAGESSLRRGQNPKVSRIRVAEIIARSTAAAASQPLLSALLEELSR